MTDTEQRDVVSAEQGVASLPASADTAIEPAHALTTRRTGPRTKKQLIIHAGIHRTGTTAVQGVLAANRDLLAARGVCYPFDFAAGGHAQEVHLKSKQHLNLVFALERNQINPTQLIEWLGQVAAGNWKIILSAEDFCQLTDLSFIGALHEAFDVEALIYLRRQDDWINSWYNQNIRWPFDETLARTTPLEFLEYIDRFHWLRYFDLLERWERAVGRENLHVRVAERGQVSDVVTDVFEVCDLPVPQDVHRDNESAPAWQLELLRRLKLIDHRNNRARMALLDALATMQNQSTSTNVYSAAVRRLIYEHFASENEKVARVYLDRPDGVLFRDTNFPDELPGPGGAAPMDEELLMSLVWKLVYVATAKGPP
jgi:hypothetical protein